MICLKFFGIHQNLPFLQNSFGQFRSKLNVLMLMNIYKLLIKKSLLFPFIHKALDILFLCSHPSCNKIFYRRSSLQSLLFTLYFHCLLYSFHHLYPEGYCLNLKLYGESHVSWKRPVRSSPTITEHDKVHH